MNGTKQNKLFKQTKKGINKTIFLKKQKLYKTKGNKLPKQNKAISNEKNK